MAAIPLFGLFTSVTILLVLCVTLPIVGAGLLNRALFGGLHWWPLAGGLFAFHAMFLMGFVNFSLGIGVALVVAALWVGLSGRRPAIAVLAFAPLAMLTALSHAFDFLFLVLLVASFELGRAWSGRATPRIALRSLAMRGGALSAVSLPAVWLVAQSLLGVAQPAPWEWGGEQRLVAALSPFSAYHQQVDTVTAVLFLGLLVLLAVQGRLRLHPVAAIGLAGLLGLFLLTPLHTGLGGFVAPRFPVFAAWLVCAGARPCLAGRPAWLVQGMLALLILLKTGFVAMTWAAYRPQLQEVQRVLEAVEPGGRVATVAVARHEAAAGYFNDQRQRGLLSFTFIRPGTHLGALAVIQRGAVWPWMYAEPNQQPLAAIGPFAGHPVTAFPLPPRGILGADLDAAGWAQGIRPDQRATMEAGWSNWRELFDYILVLHGRAVTDHDAFLPDRLELARDEGFAVLYRVKRP